MSVVLRCPHCGTEQQTLGECDTCSEAQVGYFCTNHNPGVWLESSTCPQCGARFGEAATLSPSTRQQPDRASPELMEPAPVPHRTEPSSWDVSPVAPEMELEKDLSRSPDSARILFDILRSAASRGRHRHDYEYEDVPVRRTGGCLKTVVSLVLLLLALFFFLPVMLSMFFGFG